MKSTEPQPSVYGTELVLLNSPCSPTGRNRACSLLNNSLHYSCERNVICTIERNFKSSCSGVPATVCRYGNFPATCNSVRWPSCILIFPPFLIKLFRNSLIIKSSLTVSWLNHFFFFVLIRHNVIKKNNILVSFVAENVCFLVVPWVWPLTFYHLLSSDIDECQIPGVCPTGICTNMAGSFSCMACDPGFAVAPSGSSCEGRRPLTS